MTASHRARARIPLNTSEMVGLRMGKNVYCASGVSGLEKREQLGICLSSRRDKLDRLPVINPIPNRAFDIFTHGGKVFHEQATSSRVSIRRTQKWTQRRPHFIAFAFVAKSFDSISAPSERLQRFVRYFIFVAAFIVGTGLSSAHLPWPSRWRSGRGMQTCERTPRDSPRLARPAGLQRS